MKLTLPRILREADVPQILHEANAPSAPLLRPADTVI